MPMSDYYIGVDRNGVPYIAHAWGNAWKNRQHKYIAKIGEGAKARYIYTKEELRAFQQGKKQQTKNTAPPNSLTALRTYASASAKSNSNTTNSSHGLTGHKKKVDGVAESGSVRRRGVGINAKVKEANEAVNAHNEYKNAQRETKRAVKALKENVKELTTGRVLKALNPGFIDPDYEHQVTNYIANTKRDTKASAKAVGKAIGDQVKSGGKFLKETGDYAGVVIKDHAANTTERMKKEFRKDAGSEKNKKNNQVETDSSRSMLGNYAMTIPRDADGIKEWASTGAKKAKAVMKRAEEEYKQMQKDYKEGKYSAMEMNIAQDIIEGMHEEVHEWEQLSSMSPEELSQLFGPLVKKK